MATFFSGISKQQQTIRQNVFFWCMLYLAMFLVMIVRLGWLQLVRYHHFNDIGERFRNRKIVLPASRGRLLDSNCAVLALDDQRESLYADPSLCIYPGESVDSPGKCTQFVAEKLAPIIQHPVPEILASLNREISFAWVKVDLKPENVAAIRALGLPGLQVREDGGRYRLSVDRRKALPVEEIAAPLAKILGLTESEVNTQLGGGRRRCGRPHTRRALVCAASIPSM